MLLQAPEGVKIEQEWANRVKKRRGVCDPASIQASLQGTLARE